MLIPPQTDPTGTLRIKSYSDTPLEELLQEISLNREDFSDPEPPAPAADQPGDDPQPPAISSEPASDKPEQTESEKRTARSNAAKFAAKNTDKGFAFVLSLIANTDDLNDWKAHPDDLDDIRDAYYEMFQAYGWGGFPPWVNLVIALGFTYGPMFREAFHVRGINRELAIQAAKDRAELEILKQKEVNQVIEANQVKHSDSGIPEPSDKSYQNEG